MKYSLKLLLFLLLVPLLVVSQTSNPNLLYINGAIVFTQSGALLHVQGDIVNNTNSTFYNNGLLNIEGDFTNNATFTSSTSGERAVRFIGNSTNAGSASVGAQTIASSSGSTSFYNMVVDMGSVGQPIVLGCDVSITGSLVWGGSNTADTYLPSNYPATLSNTIAMQVRGSTPTGSGVIQLYTGTSDKELYVTNGNASALIGFKSPTWGTAATVEDKCVRTRGAKGVGIGGLSREVWQTGSYFVFPLSTSAHTYNPIKFKFTAVSSTTNNKVRGLFCDATGTIGTISKSLSNSCDFTGIATVPTLATLDNNGYNIYTTNPCSSGTRNWIVFDNLPNNGGFWSFDGNSSNKYMVELYPNSMTFQAASIANNNIRAIKYHNGAAGVSDIAFDPSNVDWSSQIENVETMPGDIYSYTGYTSGTSTSSCSSNYTNGIPGGIYNGFSHFQVVGARNSSANGNTLPVELILFNAKSVDNSFIRLEWITGSEQDNKGFEVMRSTDGVNFNKIGWVDGNGNSSNTIVYSFDDKDVIANREYYYMLNQIDFDGNTSNSDIVYAEITSSDIVQVSEFFPNPTLGKTQLNINATNSYEFSFKLTNILGEDTRQGHSYNNTSGNFMFDIDLGSLAAGTYNATIKINERIFYRKLIVLK
jgi:hypothetical protein